MYFRSEFVLTDGIALSKYMKVVDGSIYSVENFADKPPSDLVKTVSRVRGIGVMDVGYLERHAGGANRSRLVLVQVSYH